MGGAIAQSGQRVELLCNRVSGWVELLHNRVSGWVELLHNRVSGWVELLCNWVSKFCLRTSLNHTHTHTHSERRFAVPEKKTTSMSVK